MGFHQAKTQIPIALDTERQNKIEDVLAKFPHQRVEYLQSRVDECYANIERCTKFKADMMGEITKYQSLIGLVGQRDEKLRQLDPEGTIASMMGKRGARRLRAINNGVSDYIDDEPVDPQIVAQYEEIKRVRREVPPYDVEQMKVQIDQFNEAVVKADTTIKTEYDSIAEFNGVLALCRQRDIELQNLGAKIGIG